MHPLIGAGTSASRGSANHDHERRWRRLAAWPLLLILLTSSLAAAQTDNFICSDSQVCVAAEDCRCESARFWTGQPLPGRWIRPCPITVLPADHSGGGHTSFIFRQGEVFGWQMHLEGPREIVLRDVLPHEIDHAVRASLVRRPIVRWLDEGCASLMESPESHARLRRLARSVELPVSVDWLDQFDYPTASDGAQMQRFYAAGFSLVEFLLEQGGPARLLAFQQDVRLPSQKLSHYDKHGATTVLARWRDWQASRSEQGDDCISSGCAIHAAQCTPVSSITPDEVLTVWTSSWCAPCRRFWQDFHDDEAFRRAILARFRLRAVDVDANLPAAKAAGVVGVPRFQTRASFVTGYQGKQWLLERLGLVSKAPDASPELTPQHPTDLASPVTESISGDTSGNDTVPADDDSVPLTVPPVDVAAPAMQPGRPTSSDISLPLGLEHTASAFSRLSRLMTASFPLALTMLQWLGILGGSAATGGVGALALRAVWLLLRRRWSRRRPARASAESSNVIPQAEGGSAANVRAPFPRRLDEARELLALRQPEGRVAVLDALRGMFLDDELQKLTDSADERDASLARRLRTAIDSRVDEVAPLSTTID